MIDKKLIILVGKDGRPSMRSVFSKMLSNSELHIRRRLQNKLGKINEYWRIFTNHNVDDFEKVNINNNDLTNKIVVRWGNRISVDLTSSIVYNKAKAIEKATNKKLSREIFIQNNLNCPKLINKQNITNEDFPIIARPLVHSKGKNFIVLKMYEMFKKHFDDNNANWYYSAFVDKKQEFRLHVAHGRILNYLEKPKPADGNIAWNRAINEDPFVNVKWSDYNKDICNLAIKAIQALGLDFGAVDIMLDKNDKACLLEVNTAGTLISSEYSMERYAKYFDWLCKTNKRREHWELKEFKKASNYAWHEYHFEDREPNKEV
jgi:hypothetical protein